MQIGTVLLDRYELVGQLGEGATSAVWEAIDRQTGERVAVKAISLGDLGWRAEVRDRFQQEARLLAASPHEHLVSVRDVGETDDGYLFTVLDKLTGETLAARIARPPPIGWREAARIALQIARGLGALHARGVVHRDIKPANVILHEEGPPGTERVHDGAASGPIPRAPEGPVAKIIDLGVSKVRAAAADPVLYATLTSTGQVLGTPEYMSYEQALGERDIDVRSDVWALGVVLYEMLAGRRPFEAPNVNAVLAAIRRGAPPSLADIAKGTPPPLIALCERCLERSKEARYEGGAALAQAIEAAVAEAERGMSAPSLPPPLAPRERVPRRRLGQIALAAALVAAAGVGLYLLSGGAPTLDKKEVVPAATSSSVTSGAPPASTPAAASSRPEERLDGGPTTALGPPPRPSARPAPARPVTRINDAGF